MDSDGNGLADLGNYPIMTDQAKKHICSLCGYEWPSSSVVAECPGCGIVDTLPDDQVIDLLAEQPNIDNLHESLSSQ